MADYAVEGAELKRLVKVARSQPIAFGFNPGKTDEDTYFGLDRKKQPAILGKAAKEGGDGNKFSFGTAVVEGKVMRLTCMRELPAMAKRLKKYLKSQKVMLNVELLDESGNVLESDIEDGLPDDPDLEGDDDDGSVAEGAPAVGAEPDAAEPASTKPVPNMAEISKRLAAIAARIKALPPEAAAKITKPFQNVVAMARAGDADGAASGADKLEAALKMLEGATAGQTPAAPASPPPDPQTLKLMQFVAAMRSKGESINDASRKTAFMGALDKVTDLIQAKEAEKAVAILKKLQEMLKTLAAGQPQRPAEETEENTKSVDKDTEVDSQNDEEDEEDEEDETPLSAEAQEWENRYGAISGDVFLALSQGLVADVSELRKLNDFATGLAADEAYVKALGILPRIEAMLKAGRGDGKSAFEAEVAEDAKPFAEARLRWAGARTQMQSEVRKITSAIMAAASEDDSLDVAAKNVSVLTDNVTKLDSKLEDALDLIVNAQASARDPLKSAARKLISTYEAELSAPFFQDIDNASGFGSVAVTATARAALADIARVLA